MRNRTQGLSASRSVAAKASLATAALIALAVAVVSVRVARVIVTPSRHRREGIRVVRSDAHTITLSSTPDTRLPGLYSLWFADATGHAKLGEILDQTVVVVTRRLLAVDFGDLATAKRGYLGGWLYVSPAELDVPFEEVAVETELGPAPAWIVPAAEPSTRWVIGVHGRGVRKAEGLRAVGVFRGAGYVSLLVSYRNDGEAPPSDDGRYALGDMEWRDVEAAMEFAVARGATEIVLMGWSMGGATVLQVATRSALAGRISGIVLESPVIDWVTTLGYQAQLLHLPRAVRAMVLALIGRRWGRALTGQAQPVDLPRLDFVRRAVELEVPILLLHSSDDGFVPVDASRRLAAARPDIVSYDEFSVARHTKLWNYDPQRWEDDITAWLGRLESASARTARPRRQSPIARARAAAR